MEKIVAILVRPFIWMAFKLGFIKDKRADAEHVVEIELSIDKDEIVRVLGSDQKNFESDFDSMKEKGSSDRFYDSVILQLVGVSKSGIPIIWNKKTSSFSSGIGFYWPIKCFQEGMPDYQICATASNGILYVSVESSLIENKNMSHMIFVAPVEQAFVIHRDDIRAKSYTLSNCKIERDAESKWYESKNLFSFYEDREEPNIKIVEYAHVHNAVLYYNEYAKLRISSTIGSMQYPE